MLAVESVIMIHQRTDETAHRLPVIVWLACQVPDGVDHQSCCHDILFLYTELEVTHLSVEGRGHLSCGKRHGKVGRESDTVYLQVLRESDRIDDSAGTDKDEHTLREHFLHQVDVDPYLSL